MRNAHGLGAQLHHFRHTLFGHFGPGYRLIALDRPGSGYSTRANGATGRLPEQAALVRRFIEKLELERPLVVGHSLGGAVTLTLAVEHPEAISGVALLAPLTHLESRVRQKFDLLYIPSRLLRRIMDATFDNLAKYLQAPRTNVRGKARSLALMGLSIGLGIAIGLAIAS